MRTKRKLGLTVIGVALVAIVGVVGWLAVAGGSNTGSTSQPSPPANAAEAATRPPSKTEATVEPDPNDRDIAAEIIGINIFQTKLTAFAISSFYAGITGVLYTYYFSAATTEAFTLGISIEFLAMVIIGGLGSVFGSILGALGQHYP